MLTEKMIADQFTFLTELHGEVAAARQDIGPPMPAALAGALLGLLGSHIAAQDRRIEALEKALAGTS